ncbi:MAG TPA: 30S ribosomal protein S20 [Halanaerobiales bacterium]|nr:30S ribosomal protein S20 [Halanaerobiales bacterium]
MPIIKSAKKRVKTTEKKTVRNREWKNRMKDAIKTFEKAAEAGEVDNAGVKLTEAIKIIDKAASRGIIHKNNAARKKSRLTRIFNKIA